MKRPTKIIFSFSVILFLILFYRYMPILPFQPRTHDGSGDHNLIKMPMFDQAQADRICTTLKKYGEIHIRAGEKNILITPKLFFDKELIWNYSNKSEI